ncbi:processed acidic surface protein [Salipaludibacillus keqinensis]|uniref:processed acidic surface protein n=1 Tax=Salipaludibacillus keqinensis TaxID=2045207 RepID=UPI0013049378|nr:processed acidic surface protein [Salipaludibacillus keqinensis]
MKGLLLSLLAGFMFVVLPSVGEAAPSGKELDSFLNEIQWTESDLLEYLDFYDLVLEDFEDMEDLDSFLGPVLTEDNLNDLLQEYGLSLEEATKLLIHNGELEEGQTILEEYTFLDDVDMDLYFYTLTPITDESLEELLLEYELSYDELLALLAENDDSIENYDYIEDLDWVVWYYLYGEEEWDDLEFDSMFTDIGLTEEEIERLFNHFLELNVDADDFLNKLEALADRLVAFEDFDGMTELSASQIAELLDIFTQLLDLFEMDVKFYLVNGEEKNPVSLETLFTMTTTNGYDLLIELYNKQGDFLADLLLTADMLNSDLVQETGKDLIKTEEIIVKHEENQAEQIEVKKDLGHPLSKDQSKESKPLTKTEHGAKLPETATNAFVQVALGLSLILTGLVFVRKFRGA